MMIVAPLTVGAGVAPLTVGHYEDHAPEPMDRTRFITQGEVVLEYPTPTIPAAEPMCAHANEVPNVCPCGPGCSCKARTCRPSTVTQEQREQAQQLDFRSNTERLTLFQGGNFRLHSGEASQWKIECDGLTDADLETLAFVIASRVGAFREVSGVPRGGLRLAAALRPYTSPGIGPVLIVDDVLTTGASMEEYRLEVDGDAIGVVLFARRQPPPWVKALFQVWGEE